MTRRAEQPGRGSPRARGGLNWKIAGWQPQNSQNSSFLLHEVVGAYVATSGQRRIGAYQLLNLIRAGHACEIWKVIRIGATDRLALKLLRRGPHYTREQIGFLKHEYLVGQRIEHPRIIRIEDFATSDDGCYLVMELYPHPNLKQQIQLGADRLAYLAERIIRDAAEALHYVHQQGWVHCDIKPDNFLVSDEGHVKLIDFSLAQRRKGRLGRLLSGRAKVQGTKSYMSPEQIRGQAIDAWSDMYSFGCVVHELLGGKVPFTGVNANDLLTKHLRSRPPTLESVNQNITREFSDLVGRMIAKDPARRPESMQALLDELDRTTIFRRRPVPPESTPPVADRR